VQHSRLGRTGLRVSVAALGTGGHSRLGFSQGASRAHSVGLVRAALDAGVNLIDTAAAYRNEDVVGEAVRGRRDEVVISTKVLLNRRGTLFNSAKVIGRAELVRRVEKCLSRLATDRIDILFLHGVTEEQYRLGREAWAPALIDLRDQGKIRFIGLTEQFIGDTRHGMLETALKDDLWDVVMVGFNMVNQTALRAVLPMAGAADVGTMCMYAVRGPLASPQRARALVEKLIAAGEVDPGGIDRDDPFGFLIGDGGAPALVDAAYRFCRHAPGVEVVLTGTGSAEHLRDNLRSIQAGPLPGPALARLAKMFGAVESESTEPGR
jgi:L-galactose dehydrogenase